MAPRLDGEEGMSLIEVLVALVLVGVVFLTLTGGMFTGVVFSGVHRKQAAAEMILRNAAEALKQAPYETCTEGACYIGAVDPATWEELGFPEPTVEIACWQPGHDPLVVPCTPDHRLQRITLTATSGDESEGRQVRDTLEIVKRRL